MALQTARIAELERDRVVQIARIDALQLQAAEIAALKQQMAQIARMQQAARLSDGTGTVAALEAASVATIQ